VIDWEYDDDGELLWAVVKDERSPRDKPTEARGLKVFTWTVYTPDGWTKYVWKQKKPGVMWTKDEETDSETEGSIPSAWCRSRNSDCPKASTSSARRRPPHRELQRALREVLGHVHRALRHAGPQEDPEGSTAATPDQPARVGAGTASRSGRRKTSTCLEPSGAAFGVATEHIAELKDELYRVVHQMALSADNSAGAMKRSGDSKAQDKQATEIVLKALSEIDAPSRERKLEMIAAARRREIEWDVMPVEKFTLESSGRSSRRASSPAPPA
jgi:hypothetical protein